MHTRKGEQPLHIKSLVNGPWLYGAAEGLTVKGAGVQRTKKNDGEAGKAEEAAAEGPSDEELKKEVEGILESAGDDFSMKDLLSKLRASLLLLPAWPAACLTALFCLCLVGWCWDLEMTADVSWPPVLLTLTACTHTLQGCRSQVFSICIPAELSVQLAQSCLTGFVVLHMANKEGSGGAVSQQL